MRLTTSSAIAAFAATALAQTLSDLPKCAQSCVGTSLTSGTGCGSIDVACICKSSGWISGLSCCVSTACNAADQNTTIKIAVGLCQPYGAKLPTSAGCSNSTSSVASSSTILTGTATSSMTRPASSTVSGTAAGARTSAAGYKEQIGMGLGVAAAGLFAVML